MLFIVVFSFTIKDADAQYSSQYVYGHNNEEWEALSMIELPNGNMMILGCAKKTSIEKEQIVLLELDENSGIVQQNSYGEENSDVPTDFINLADGGFLITGTSTDDSGNSDVFLLRINSARNPIFFKTYGGSEQDSAFVVRVLNDGYIIGGKTDSWGAGENDALLIHTDSYGVVVWAKAFGDSQNESCNDLEINSDNEIYFCGTSESFSTGSESFLFAKVDENGNLIFSKTYGMSGQDRCYNLATFDDKFLLAGQTNSIGNGLWDVMIAFIEVDGSLDFARSYGDEYDNSFCGLSVNTSIYLSSSRVIGPSKKLVLQKVLANGLLSSTQQYGVSTFTTTTKNIANHSLLATSDNLFLCGNTNSDGPGNKNIIYIKAAPDGTTTCNSASIVFGYDVANPTTIDAAYSTTNCAIITNTITTSSTNPETVGWDFCSEISSDFVATPLSTCPGGVVQFTNLSSGSTITSWNWEFEGGVPSTFSGENPPDIVYNQIGDFMVSLTVSDGLFFVPEIKNDYISIISSITVFTLSGGGASCTGTPTVFQAFRDHRADWCPPVLPD